MINATLPDLRAQVYAYANPFASPPRIEVLVDWSDAWPWPDPAWLKNDVSFHLYLFGDEHPPTLETGFSPLPGSEVVAKPMPFLEGANADGAGSEFVKSVLTTANPSFRTGDFHFSNFGRDLLDGNPTKETFRRAPHFYFTTAPHIGKLRELEATRASSEAWAASSAARETAFRAMVTNLADAAVGHADRLLSFKESLPAGNMPPASPRNPIAVLRSAAREEPTLGHLFRVLFYLDADVASWWKPGPSGTSPIGTPRPSRLWLVARPFVGGSSTAEPLARFLPVPTRLGLTPPSFPSNSALSKVITVLHALNDASEPEDPARKNPNENVCGFWAETVSSRSVDGDDLPLHAGRLFHSHGGSLSSVLKSATITSTLLRTRDLGQVLCRKDLDTAAFRLWRESEGGKAEAAGVPGKRVGLLNARALEVDRPPSTEAQQWIDDRVSAAASLHASRPRFDAIGIAWTFPTPQESKYHRGFKGYRLDVQVRLQGQAAWGPWTSLCQLERRALAAGSWRVLECHDGGSRREGVVTQSVLGDPTSTTPSKFVAPRDFVWWSTPSVIKPYPLDRLGILDKPKDALDPIKLEEVVPKGLPMPTYGNGYRFAVRKVGLSGMSPSPADPPPCSPGDPDLAALSSLDPFLRTIPIAAPEVAVLVSDRQWSRVDSSPPVAEGKTQEPVGSIDGVWRVRGAEPRVGVLALAPIAHYKVALHARGANEDDVADGDLKTRFEEACLTFARKAAASFASDGKVPAPFAKALDPHLGGVELVTRTWYPFSDFKLYGDRFVPTGRQVRTYAEIARSGFVELFVQGQRLAETTSLLTARTDVDQDYRAMLFATVAGKPGLADLPDKLASWGKPVIYPGVRNRLECRGVWDAAVRDLTRWNPGSPELAYDTVAPDGQQVADGRESWTSSLVVFNESCVPIGGKVELARGIAVAKLVTYSGLADPLQERVLLPPPTGGGTPPDTAPARGTAIAWRRLAFKDPAALTGDIDQAYTGFVARLLGTVPQLVKLRKGLKDNNPFLEVTLSAANAEAFVAPAFSLPGPVHLRLTKDGIAATIGSDAGERRLPFVDDDISHLVRITWSVPINGSHLERPRDLAAVKEFELYRTERGKPIEEGASPRARLPRPPDSIFRLQDGGADDLIGKHLDEIEWTWIDGVEDRDLHEYDYHVVAVPEHPESYAPQTWYRIPVTIPCCDLEARPGRVVPLPLTATGYMERRLAFYLPRCEDLNRITRGRLAWRLLATAADPLVEPGAPSNAWPSVKPYAPKAHTDIFPSKAPGSLRDEQLPDQPYDLDAEGWAWAEVAEEADDPCELRAEQPRRPDAVCDVSSSGHPVLVVRLDPRTHAAFFKRNGPFFKLQLQIYMGDRFPRLRHTLATETFETDWLQCYPEPLPLPEFGDRGVLLPRSNPAGSHLRYRFHVFAAAAAGEPGTAFQLESYYRLAPRLTPETLQDALDTRLPAFVGPQLDELRLFVTAEEGFALDSYSIADESAPTEAEPWFVVLRSSQHALELRARNEGKVWKLVQPKGN